MKKINLIERLLSYSHEKQSPQRFARYAAMLILLLTIGVGQMWADTNIGFSGGYIYFDPYYDATHTVNGGYIQLAGRKSNCSNNDWYTAVTTLNNIANTRLYYTSSLEGSGWSNVCWAGWAIISGSQNQGNTSDELWNSGKSSWWSEFKSYGMNSGSTYLWVATSSIGGQSIQPTGTGYLSEGYSALNSTQTINTVVKAAGGSYTAANSQATISITSYEMTGDGTVTKRTPSLGTSAKTQTVSAARTATTTFTVGDVATGYQFDGWYTAATGGTLLSASSTYTYYPTAATTVYARFSEKMSTVTLTASPSEKGSFTIGGAAATSTTAGVTTTRSVTAVPISGYHFVSWAITGGATISNTTDNPVTVTGTGAGTAATLTATFAADDVYSLTVAAGTGISSVSGSTNDIKAGNNIAISAIVATGYTWSMWTKTAGSGTLSTFTEGTKDQTVTVGTAGDITLTASATENMSALSTSCHYDAGDPSYAAPSVAGSHTDVGYVTERTITATPAGTGYTFAGWTLSDNLVVTGGDKDNDLSITVRTNGNGAAATAQANYNEDRSSRWHLVGNSSDFPDGWNVNSTTMMQKKTGHSTESAVYFTVDVTSTDTKEFKVVDDNGASSDIWYGYSSGDTYLTWTATSTKTVYAKDEGGTDHNANNLKYTPTVTGPYEFKVDYSGTYPAVTITYPVSYTLTYSIGSVAGTAGSISTSPETASGGKVLSGSTVNLTAPEAKAGYSWDGWYTDAAGTEGKIEDDNRAITVTMDADKTLYACYTEDNYTVTVNASAGGSVASASVTAHKDTKVSLPNATANNGYYFTGWEVTSGTASITGDATDGKINGVSATGVAVQANFAPIWRITGGNDDDSDAMGDWSTTANQITSMTTSAGVTSGSVDISLPANKEYQFKVYNASTNKYWGNNTGSVTPIDYTNKGTAVTLTEAAGDNQPFKTAGAGTYTFTWDVTNNKITISYPTSYTVTFGMGTGGATITATGSTSGTLSSSGDYVTSGENVTFTQTATSTGYTFAGWYDAESGGSAVSKMGTSDNILESITANATVYSRYTPNNYTITFNYSNDGGSIGDLNGATNTEGVVTKSVTYASTYGDLPTATKSGSCFKGWYTTYSGEGSKITSASDVTITSAQTLHARFESTYVVTVNYKCGDDVLKTATVTSASAYECPADIEAPEFFGYSFVNWTGDNATFGSSTSASTTVKASASTTITANYSELPRVYFKNNLNWDTVYVTFNCSWNDRGGKQVPGNSDKPYFGMKRIGSTDIYYCDIPSDYTTSDYASWANDIAFDNHGFTSSDNVGGYGDFFQNEFLGRGDFDPYTTLYIPYDGDTETRNSGTYYPTGCWLKYNSSSSCYQVNVNESTTADQDDITYLALTATVAGGYEYSCSIDLKSSNYTYGIKLYKIHKKNTAAQWFTNTGTYTSAYDGESWHFWNGDAITASSQRMGLTTTAKGEYTFTVNFATGRPVVTIIYPLSVNDYRVLYKDDVHTSWKPSRVIKNKPSTNDTVSYFVRYNQNGSMKIQKCTAIDGSGNATWADLASGSVIALTSITKDGYYNFKITQPASGDASGEYLGEYTGDFYIRTDGSKGGWTDYKSSQNALVYSEYAANNENNKVDFTHYHMTFLGEGRNIKFVIANDYSPCISDTLEGDSYTDDSEWLPAGANIRFMWNKPDNTISRAYLSGSSVVSDRFLVLEGDAKMFDRNGTALSISGLDANQINFTDDQNWIYETVVKAQPGAQVKLTAKFNKKYQFFYGDEGTESSEDSVLLLGGSTKDANKYTVRVVYDFKTDRLIKAFVPEGIISTELAINADLMIIREAQEDAKQISFSGSGALKDVQLVYGAMKFNKYTLNNKAKTAGHASLSPLLSKFERGLYWISFPFDVKLGEVFGFGEYGRHWIIEYYDGAERARTGYWADSDGFWHYVMPNQRNSFTLKANQGYVLALDLDEMTESSSVWDNGVDSVYIYFPSDGEVENITATNKLLEIEQDGFECTIGPRNPAAGLTDDRTKKDSYWHIIGVPSFANYSSALTVTSEGGAIDWRSTSMPYLYVWNAETNNYDISSTADFSFKATYAYMVQYSEPSIYWSTVNTPTPSTVVARQADIPQNVEFRIELQNEENKEDQTFVRLTDDANVTGRFEFNYDICKEYNRNSANIWTVTADTVEVAGNCLPTSTQTTIIPVGVKVVANGDYTFSIPDGTSGVNVTFVDTYTGTRTSLSLIDYTTYLTTGTHEGRFMLEIAPISQMPTDLENAANANANANADIRKVFVGGRLYILRDGKAYDATGAQVR